LKLFSVQLALMSNKCL